MHIDSLFRAVTGPCSTERFGAQLAEARLVGPACAPRLGRFTLIEEVGRGGMGVVFAAFDAELERKVAVKILHAEVPRDRLLREAQALATVEHTNIVTIYEVGEHHGQAYIAMEFIDGRSLGELQRLEPGPWRRWLRIYLEAGRGLHHAHLAGLVHRDFKPDNVLVRRDGRVVVADFGLAKRSAAITLRGDDQPLGSATSSCLTRAGARPGTTRYMAPEQLAGAACDARSDQYSFCLALWQAVHGELPLAVEERDRLDAWRILGCRRLHTPMWFRRVVLRGLHPEPRMRWPSMEVLIHQLQQDPMHRLRRMAIVALVGLVVVWGVGLVLNATAEKARADESARQKQHELVNLQRRRLDDMHVSSARLEQDPTIAAGILAAVGDADATPSWRNAAINTLLRPISAAILRGHTGELRGVTFSPDSRHVATASFDHTIGLRRTDGVGEPQVLVGHTDAVHIVVFSPDGRLLASTSRDGTVRLWDLARPGVSQVLRGHVGPVWFVAFSPDGRTIATSGDHGSLFLWQRSDDATALEFRQIGALEGHEGDVWHIEFSPDGRRLVSAGEDKTARIWSLDTRTPLKVLQHDSRVLRARFSPDGTKVVTAGDRGYPRVWPVADGPALHDLTADRKGVRDARFDPTGQFIATAGNDRTAKLWSVATGELLRTFRLEAGASAIDFSPTGDMLAAASMSGSVRVWRTHGHGGAYELIGHAGGVFEVSFSRSGQYLVSSSVDRTARVWDVNALRHGVSRRLVEDTADWTAVCSDAARLALARKDAIQLHDLETGRRTRLLRVPGGGAQMCVLGPDSRALVALVDDGSVYRWDLSRPEGAELVAVGASTFAFATGGDVLVGHLDGSLSLVSAAGEPVERVQAHTLEVTSLSGLFGGRYIASSGRDGSLVRLDVSNGLRQRKLGDPTGFRLSGYGGCLDRGLLPVWNSRNDQVVLWDIPHGVKVRTINSDGKVPGSVYIDCKRDLLVIVTRSGDLLRRTLDGRKLSQGRASFGTGTWSALFTEKLALLFLSDRGGGLRIFEASTLAPLAGLEDASAPVVASDRDLVVISRERGVTRVDLSTLLRPNVELQAELRSRTTACPGLEQWRAVYSHDEEGARQAAADCELRHGRVRTLIGMLHPAGERHGQGRP